MKFKEDCSSAADAEGAHAAGFPILLNPVLGIQVSSQGIQVINLIIPTHSCLARQKGRATRP